ncbi:hypothetical protein FKP32DRAFT_1572268 [Trametes sanguinea]|nr:hypothetical protein FKP32DRAFT_1572268 [Trametes sanguinea]
MKRHCANVHDLADKTHLARDLWPEKLGQVHQERDLTVATLPDARKLPEELEELAEWLWVDRQDALSQALVYVHGDVEGTGTSSGNNAPVELVLRIQGVIADMNVAIGGDWDGTEVNAKRANQHLTLVSGGCSAAFDPQVRAVKALREAVLAQLGKHDDRQRGRMDGGIVLRRRVFTKIRPDINDHLPTVIRDADDPRGRFKAIANHWRPTEKLQAGTQLAHGEIFAVNPLSLRKGDLVDVSARVVVAFTRGVHGRRYEMSIEPMIIVRLASASTVQVRTPQHRFVSCSKARSSAFSRRSSQEQTVRRRAPAARLRRRR